MTWQCSGTQVIAVHAHFGSLVIGLGLLLASIIATIILLANDASRVVPMRKMPAVCQQYYMLTISSSEMSYYSMAPASR